MGDSMLRRILTTVGDKALPFFGHVAAISSLSRRSIVTIFTQRWDVHQIIQQFFVIGNRSLGIVFLIAIFTGMVLALQFTISLGQFGLSLYVGQVVGLSITRELGPVLTSLMVAARVGSGIAAELGSMVVTEQVLAIEAMGANPTQQLVAPRVIATVISTPLLAVVANATGVLGGMIISITQSNVTPQFYMDQIWKAVTIEDFAHGVAKTFIFGFFVAVISCYQGLTTSGGTAGVGQSTTRAVVWSSVFIFISDFFLTKLLIML